MSKVLFIMHMPPPVHGAAMMGKYIRESGLVNSEFDCHFLNMTVAKSLEDIGKGGMRKYKDVINKIHEVCQTVNDVKPDVVYVTPNTVGMPFYKDFLVIMAIKSEIKRIKKEDHKYAPHIVAHFHNKGVATRQDHWIDDKLYRKFFNGLKVILLSDLLYKDIEKYVKREDVFICPNGIPSICKAKKINRNTNDPLSILYLSNMMVEKGVWTLLDACYELKNNGLIFRCDFVGGWKDISKTAFINKVVAYGLQEYVTAHGAKYGSEKIEFLEKSDLFVFPTYNECFGLVLLEAMQNGLACIATTEGAIPEIIQEGKTGLLIPKHDVNALTSCIVKLINNRNLCYNMGEEGRKRFEKMFTINKFEQKIVEALHWTEK